MLTWVNRYFTLYGYNTLSQSLNLLRDLKMVSTHASAPTAPADATRTTRANTPRSLRVSPSRCKRSAPSS